jgi:hypothetical protein
MAYRSLISALIALGGFLVLSCECFSHPIEPLNPIVPLPPAGTTDAPGSYLGSLRRSDVPKQFEIQRLSRWIMYCYESGQRYESGPSGGDSISDRIFGRRAQRPGEDLFGRRAERLVEDLFGGRDERPPAPRYEFPCNELTQKPDGRNHFVPAIGTITSETYSRTKQRVAEEFRIFVCDRMRAALLGSQSSSDGECPIGEQRLATWLFMNVTSDVNKAFLTVMAEVYGRSEYLAVRQEKYWERYSLSFQAVEKSSDETMVVVAIDEAKEEKNGDDKKLIQFKSPIGAEHTKEVEALFNRITSATFRN